MNHAPTFSIPDHLNASEPIERQGKQRSDVRMLVLDRDSHRTFHEPFTAIANYLQQGDILVLNRSRSIPSRLIGSLHGETIELRLSHERRDGLWDGLILSSSELHAGDRIFLSSSLSATLIEKDEHTPLWRVAFSKRGAQLLEYVYRYGEPIGYEYIKSSLSIQDYQTVYSSAPGSVEMCSAGRPFTWQLLARLKQKGVRIAFLELHTGLSYYENDVWPDPAHHPEHYHIPKETIEELKKGKRIIAVGTTVVRALETYAQTNRSQGTTTLSIDAGYELQLATGLLTGFHEPQASHLHMLAAFVQEQELFRVYEQAIRQGYQWHEFVDVNFILPLGDM
ncbi:S-adenosylmethionine:tRNA ribosyltransferase-isomerase [Halalkalibacterium halodurans]|uniref:S-adenosylmethionine:tRNA ribosyltransferase-isomerase n=1 Tax=Halalkalibacterium halodurans TaxID=86665 RepID=UPI001067C9C1|nr:S-adenosylmethionine:tRNA ribosyltransferase-isomerase [Halalkalibacterium halodurans]TES57509.1 S-adenosylmethionine:tRNA ribosyltransferase-isomerase [Halalkalibacterium halodurans]